ncbi:MAG: hypothetical protein DMG19_00175 [Acidobacteria bacterium]|nr:MAG: hypothetical protein DMG19_00175 [Acidobacteriota bacterium]
MAKANGEAEIAPGSANRPMVKYRLILEPCGSLMACIRSEYPVKSLKSSTRTYIERISAALSDGVTAECDLSRHDFFEIALGNIWIYLHICEQLQSVYIVAVLNPDR